MDNDIEEPPANTIPLAVPRARLDAPPARFAQNNSRNSVKVQQPKPQALPARTSGSAILVSPRQKGNPILNNIRALPWEYADIPADYVLGVTTCALFLSLKYHKLHPEYIYTRIKGLAGKYNLRVVLTLVDIPGHEEPLKELTKTSLINNVTIILCWSAQEGARYLELYKSYENAAPTSIRGHQATSYSDRVVEFITTPRSINKTDAVGLVSVFGSMRNAVNASPEQVAHVDGWGEKKVQQWCSTVARGFRQNTVTRRRSSRQDDSINISRAATLSRGNTQTENNDQNQQVTPRLEYASTITKLSARESLSKPAGTADLQRDLEPGEDEDAAALETTSESRSSGPHPVQALPKKDKHLTEGMEAALKRLRGET